MMDLFRMMREVQKANEASGAEGTENPFEMLKMLMPEESQKDFEMISSMMEMMQAALWNSPNKRKMRERKKTMSYHRCLTSMTFLKQCIQ